MGTKNFMLKKSLAYLLFACLFVISCLTTRSVFDSKNEVYVFESNSYFPIYRTSGASYKYTFDTVTQKEEFMIIFRNSSPSSEKYVKAVSDDGISLKYVKHDFKISGALWVENLSYFIVPESYLFELKDKEGSFEYSLFNQDNKEIKVSLKYYDIKKFLEGVDNLRKSKNLEPDN